MTAAPIPSVEKKTVAFMGLGSMGSGMAARLVAAGHDVRGFDIDAGRLDALGQVGGTTCKSVADACDGASIIMTILPKDAHVREVHLGSGGVAETASPGTLVLEMSTVSPATSLELHDCLTRAGMRVLDAPVGRTPTDASNGTLLVMAGGATEDFAAAYPVIAPISNKAVHLGPKGCGIRMKLANNYMTMVSIVLTAETLVLAKKAGIQTAAAVEVLQSTVAGKGQINVNYPNKVLVGDITPDFPLHMGNKDLSLGLDLGRELDVPLFLGASARELFGMAEPMGLREYDCTAMLLLIERLAGMAGELERVEAEETGGQET